MKRIKFSSNLVPLVLSGDKTTTWRLFDDKDIKPGDELELVEAGTQKVFATATVVSVRQSAFGQLTAQDWEGHETYSSQGQMYETYQGYYGKPVGPQTIVKIIKFKLA